MLLSEILAPLDGEYELVRDGEFALLEQCTRIRGKRALTYLENPKYLPALENPNISCVICTPELAEAVPASAAGGGVALSSNPKYVFFQIHSILARRQEKWPSRIAASAWISPLAWIAPNNVIIGEDVEIQPFVAVHENTVIEDGARICTGTIVGGQSFTNVKGEREDMLLAVDAGSTRIETGAEICGGCYIARGTLEKDVTVVGAYAKLDAMVHVGHGTVIGKRVLIPACVALSGNCEIGDDVWIGVNATVSNRICIGDGARISLGSVVTKDVSPGETVTGNFAIPHQKFLSNLKKSVSDEKLT